MNREVFINELQRRMDLAGRKSVPLALDAGLKRDFIKDIFNGKSQDPGVLKLNEICRILGCRVDDLINPQPALEQQMADAGNNLRVFIEGLGKTPEEVASEFKVRPAELGIKFGGAGYPSLPFLIAFCAKYGCSMDWIFRQASGLRPSLMAGRSPPEIQASPEASRAKEPQAP